MTDPKLSQPGAVGLTRYRVHTLREMEHVPSATVDVVLASEHAAALSAKDARIAELEAGSDVQIWFHLKMENHDLKTKLSAAEAELADSDRLHALAIATERAAVERLRTRCSELADSIDNALDALPFHEGSIVERAKAARNDIAIRDNRIETLEAELTQVKQQLSEAREAIAAAATKLDDWPFVNSRDRAEDIAGDLRAALGEPKGSAGAEPSDSVVKGAR